MKPRFFKDLPGKYKVAYRNYYTGRNLSAVRIGSVIFLFFNLLIRVLYLVFPRSLSRAENFPEFNIANWVFIGTALGFFIISNMVIEFYKRSKEVTAIMALVIFAFALFLICSGMFSSFMATGSPRDALTLYVIGLTLVSLVFVFEYYETIILIIAAELLFTALLFYNLEDPTEVFYNQVISIILFGGFYLSSRYFFSFKANYYAQIQEIRGKNTVIERASEFKSQLLGTVAHDLRNPIAAIDSIAMLMEMDDIDPNTQENLYLIKASCNKARNIIEDLLESARNDNGSEFVMQKTEINRFLIDNIDIWKHQKNAKNIELVSSVSPAYAMINKEKFLRVFDNLIGNALKFSPEKSKVEVFLSHKNSRLILEVKDKGIGIPASKLPIIFEPFTKAGRAGLKGEQSTGLGLSIVKQLVEKHHGRIEVESEEGKGSIFRVSLPEIAPAS